LDEVYIKINGKMAYLWRAADEEGRALDVVVQRRRNTKAATRLLRKLLKNQGVKPTRIVIDRLGSYGAALKILGLKHLHDVGGRKNNRAECSHVPIRRRDSAQRAEITKVSIDKKHSKNPLSPRLNL
jgi:transposase-like protein